MSRPGVLEFTVYENPAVETSPPRRPSLRVVDRGGAEVISFHQVQDGVLFENCLSTLRDIRARVHTLVLANFRRQALESLSETMEGRQAYVLVPDGEALDSACGLEGSLRSIAGQWFLRTPGGKLHKITSSDTIYVAPFGSSW